MSLTHCATHCHSLLILEFPVGWCSRVIVCLHPITSHKCLTALDANYLAASEWRCSGHPSFNIISSSRHSVTVAALRRIVCTPMLTSRWNLRCCTRCLWYRQPVTLLRVECRCYLTSVFHLVIVVHSVIVSARDYSLCHHSSVSCFVLAGGMLEVKNCSCFPCLVVPWLSLMSSLAHRHPISWPVAYAIGNPLLLCSSTPCVSEYIITSGPPSSNFLILCRVVRVNEVVILILCSSLLFVEIYFSLRSRNKSCDHILDAVFRWRFIWWVPFSLIVTVFEIL
jgi:hypothetical protein